MALITVNEEVGSKLLVEDTPDAAWLVKHNPGNGRPRYVTAIAKDREIAETIITRNVAFGHGRKAGDYSVEVWHIYQSVEEVREEE